VTNICFSFVIFTTLTSKNTFQKLTTTTITLHPIQTEMSALEVGFEFSKKTGPAEVQVHFKINGTSTPTILYLKGTLVFTC
jgi:hypothetical protein